jgi:4-hydroxybenzoate polyprenyltransferase
MISASATDEGLSLPRIFVSAGGMFFVALICACSGFVFGLGGNMVSSYESTKGIFVLGYAALVFPYFYSRYASVEGPPPSQRKLLEAAQFVPAILFLPATAFFAAITWIITPYEQWRVFIGLLALALGPFVYLCGEMLWHLTRKGPDAVTIAVQERYFKNKVLLPAFATCLVSFSFGWSLNHPGTFYENMVIPFVLIVVGRRFIAPKRTTWAVLFVTSIILAAFIYALSTGSDVTNIIIVGTILTMAMGVAEVCKRVVWITKGDPIRGAVVDGEDANFYLAGSNWSSVLFPLLLCLLPLLIPSLPVLPIFLLLSLQYLHWHFLSFTKTSPLLSGSNVVLGFALPVVVGLQHFHLFSSLFGWLSADRAMVVGFAFVGVGLAAIHILAGEEFRQFLSEIGLRRTYLSSRNCFHFFLLIALVLIFGISILLAMTGPGSYLEPKAKDDILLLIILVIVATAANFLPALMGIQSALPLGKDLDDREGGGIRQRTNELILLIFKVGRLPVGIVAGAPAFSLLASHSNYSLVAIMFCSIPIVTTTMAGFVLNDIFDRREDHVSRRNKPIAEGRVGVFGASLFAAYLCAVSIACAAVSAHEYSLLVIITALLGVITYSFLAHRIPVAKGMITAILSCSPMAYAAEISGLHFPLQYYALVVTFIFGRELLLDTRDFRNDSINNILTLVAYLRPPLSRALGWNLMLLSLLVSVLATGGFARALFSGAVASLSICFLIYIRDENRGLVWSRATLLIASIGAAMSI